MFGIGFQEMLIILVVVLIFFGPKRLPGLAKSLGKGVAGVQKAVDAGPPAGGTRVGDERRGNPPTAYRASRRTPPPPHPLADRSRGRPRPLLQLRGTDLRRAPFPPHRHASVGLAPDLHRTDGGVPHVLQDGPVGGVRAGVSRHLLPDMAFRESRPVPEGAQAFPRLRGMVHLRFPRGDGVRLLRRDPRDPLLLPVVRPVGRGPDAVDEGIALPRPAPPDDLRDHVRTAVGALPRWARRDPDAGVPPEMAQGGGPRGIPPRRRSDAAGCGVPDHDRLPAVRAVRDRDRGLRPRVAAAQRLPPGIPRLSPAGKLPILRHATPSSGGSG